MICTGKAETRRCCSGGQTGPETGINRRVVALTGPTLEVDRSPTFFEAYLTDELLIFRKVTKLEIAHAAFGAVEMPILSET